MGLDEILVILKEEDHVNNRNSAFYTLPGLINYHHHRRFRMLL